MLRVSLLELVLCLALLRIDLGFLGAVGVDAALGEVVGAAACDDEGSPAVAITLLALDRIKTWKRSVAWQREKVAWLAVVLKARAWM